MRELGSKTALGQNLPEKVEKSHLEEAIRETKGLKGYAEFEELLEVIQETETALANGETDETKLRSLLERIEGLKAKLVGENAKSGAPDTGVLGSEANARMTTSVLAAISTLATVVGAALIAKCRLEKTAKN